MNESEVLVIWEFEVYVSEYLQHIKMPKGATFLYVQEQDGQPLMWWMLNPSKEKEMRSFRIVGTGHPTIRAERDTHLGTFQQPPFAWHLFEVLDVERILQRHLQGD